MKGINESKPKTELVNCPTLGMVAKQLLLILLLLLLLLLLILILLLPFL